MVLLFPFLLACGAWDDREACERLEPADDVAELGVACATDRDPREICTTPDLYVATTQDGVDAVCAQCEATGCGNRCIVDPLPCDTDAGGLPVVTITCFGGCK